MPAPAKSRNAAFVEGGSTDGGEAVAFSPEGPDRLLDIPFVS
jgi:hypothetical protein